MGAGISPGIRFRLQPLGEAAEGFIVIVTDPFQQLCAPAFRLRITGRRVIQLPGRCRPDLGGEIAGQPRPAAAGRPDG